MPTKVVSSDLVGKTVAIDGDLLLHQALYGHTSGTTVDAVGLANVVTRWLNRARSMKIHTLFVTTGGKSPIEKQTYCHQVRKRKREQQRECIHKLEKELDTLDTDVKMGEYICARDRLVRMKSNMRFVDSKTAHQVSTILSERGFECLRAVSEADFLLVLLSEQGKCDYVATSDADILVSGAHALLRNFTRVLSGAEGTVFEREGVMKSLGLDGDHESLLQLAILLRCDYQPPIENIGPRTALKIIQDFGTIDCFLKSPTKKRKFRLPCGMTSDEYIQCCHRTVQIFQSRPDLKNGDGPTDSRTASHCHRHGTSPVPGTDDLLADTPA